MSRRISVLSVCLFVACCMPCAAQTGGRPFTRLPSVDSDPSDAIGLEAGDAISFAAGAVQLQAPGGWWVQELPLGREVRLVFSPQEFRRRTPTDSVWICYHARETTRLAPEAELQGLLQSRSRLFAAAATFGAPVVFRHGPWVAIAQDFVSTDARNNPAAVKGRHVLVRTDWGIFELHAATPVERFDDRAAAWALVWDSLRLEAPALASADSTTTVPDARPILGSWKSYRSRMRLRSDGTISLIPDSVNLLTASAGPRAVDGTFEAQGDLLFVTWRDGSRLNLRWRMRGGDLLLTDHEGQISQLKRLLE